MGDPVQRDLGGGTAGLFRDLLGDFKNAPVAIGEFVEDRIVRGLQDFQPAALTAGRTLPGVLAAEEATGQRAPRTNAHAELKRSGNMFAFDVALNQRVLQLQSDGPLESLLFSKGLRSGCVPGRNVGEAVVA